MCSAGCLWLSLWLHCQDVCDASAPCTGLVISGSRCLGLLIACFFTEDEVSYLMKHIFTQPAYCPSPPQVDVAQLEAALLTRKLMIVGEVTIKNNSLAQAEEARDSLAKGLYAGLFNWLVEQVNAKLAPQVKTSGGWLARRWRRGVI